MDRMELQCCSGVITVLTPKLSKSVPVTAVLTYCPAARVLSTFHEDVLRSPLTLDFICYEGF